MRPLNEFRCIAVVVTDPTFRNVKGKLISKCVCKTRSVNGVAMFDLYGIKKTATKMNLCCRRGNRILLKACLFNGRQAGSTSLRLLMNDCKVVSAPKKAMSKSQLQEIEGIISSLDPDQILNGQYTKKTERKFDKNE